MGQHERNIFNEDLREKRVTNVRSISDALDQQIRDSKFDPSAPLNVIARIASIVRNGGPKEDVSNGVEPKRGIVLLKSIEQLAQYSYATHILESLEAICETSYDNSVFLNISECEREEELVNTVKSLFNGIKPELCEQLTQGGKMKGILTVSNLLRGEVRDKLYDRLTISHYADEEFTDDGSDFVLPTNIEGVMINYFFPIEEDMADMVQPTIALLIHPLV